VLSNVYLGLRPMGTKWLGPRAPIQERVLHLEDAARRHELVNYDAPGHRDEFRPGVNISIVRNADNHKSLTAACVVASPPSASDFYLVGDWSAVRGLAVPPGSHA
jgi:hypothetical protein